MRAGPQGGGDRRRQRRHRFGPHRAPHGRRGDRHLSPRAQGHAGHPRGDRGRRAEGAKFVFLATPHRIVGDERGQRQGHRSGQDAPRRVRFLRPPPPGPHRRDPAPRVRHRHPGGRRGGRPGFRAAPPACASRRTARSRWTATRSRPAAASSTPAATSSPAPPTSRTPWATARRRRATSTSASWAPKRWDRIDAADSTYGQTPPDEPSASRRHNARRAAGARARGELRGGHDRPERRGGAAKKPRAACAATSGHRMPRATQGETDMPDTNLHPNRRRVRGRAARARPSSRWPAPAASTSPRSATWKASAPWAPAACAWWRSPASAACCPPAPRRCRTACRVTTNSEKLHALPPDRARAPASPSATTSAPSASPTATASCRPWRRAWASPTSAIRTTTRSLPVDVSHPRFVLDHNRCILCTRCVRVCDEVEGAHVWDVSARGIRSRDGLRPEPALGRGAQLHQLRQVRAGLPHRRAGREGLRASRKWPSRIATCQRLAARRGGHVMKKVKAGDRVARRLLRLPHVAARHRRGDRRRRQAAEMWSTARWWTRRSFPRAWTSRWSKAPSAARTTWRRSRTIRAAQQAGGGAGRLRRHQQRPGHAQPHPARKMLERVYVEGAQANRGVPTDGVPALLRQAVPLHEVVKVDLHVPGLPALARRPIAFVARENCSRAACPTWQSQSEVRVGDAP